MFLKECAMVLIELTSGSFEFGNQTSMESLRLNSELLDVLIDLFGEDNLSDLEVNLGFIEKIKSFSEKFYTKVMFWLFFDLFGIFLII